jgi:hypothetical protein
MRARGSSCVAFSTNHRNTLVRTYSLGFFLGPGLPRSRGGAFGSIDGGARFRPVMVPPPRFLLLSVLGGARDLGSPSSLLKEGMGVALDSDDLSALSGGCTDGEDSGLMSCVAGPSDGKAASLSEERRSVIILLFFVARFCVADDDMALEAVWSM